MNRTKKTYIVTGERSGIGYLLVKRSAETSKETIAKTLQIRQIDGLINCAGIGYRQSLLELMEQDFEQVFATNIKGGTHIRHAHVWGGADGKGLELMPPELISDGSA
jgi:NAD(P)-dependent dehydrogenase (short-subunit alcohol dehydrogenase family)